MTKIGSLEIGASVDTSRLKAALNDVRDAIQNLDDKMEALNEVDVPVEIGGVKISALDRIRDATLKAERMADRPSPSYRAADPQASEM